MSPEKATFLTTTGRRQLDPGLQRLVVALAFGLLALSVAGLTAAGPAAAANPCAKRVIDDWYGDGRVDGNYPLHCYDDAIEALPNDVKNYSSAPEDIERAMQARLRGEEAPPSTTDPDGDSGTGGPTAPNDPDAPTSSADDPTRAADGPKRSANGPTVGDKPGETATGLEPEVAPRLDPTAASDSVPVPLLILAGLAFLLIAAGSAGYLVRRLQARRVPPHSL